MRLRPYWATYISTTHAHTRLTALLPGLPGWAGTRKVKTNLDFTEARDSEWQWHQLGHVQVCISLRTGNHASTLPLKFFTGRMPFLLPNRQRQSTEGKKLQYPGTISIPRAISETTMCLNSQHYYFRYAHSCLQQIPPFHFGVYSLPNEILRSKISPFPHQVSVSEEHIPWKHLVNSHLSPSSGPVLSHCHVYLNEWARYSRPACILRYYHISTTIVPSFVCKADTVAELQARELGRNRHIVAL